MLYVTPDTNWKLFFLKPAGGLLRKLSVVENCMANRLNSGKTSAAVAFAEYALGLFQAGNTLAVS